MNIKETDQAELMKLIEKAKSCEMTEEEKFEQRVSFVYGQLINVSPEITHAEVRREAVRIYGEPKKEQS